jgi:NADPH:quinone reductase-like Zn-dependent oxidoreductase/acyl carrier protein/NADP-dependent 3-hydroxy acid dehydrogenase YdfG
MDGLEGEFLSELAQLSPSAPSVPLYSTLTGARVEGAVHDAAYWWRNTRQPVRLRAAVARLLADGHRAFQEVGPQPVLAASIRECAEAAGQRVLTVATLKRGEPEGATVEAACARLWVAGHRLQWGRRVPAGRLADLPAYPWQRERHWEVPPALREARLGRETRAPLLGRRVDGPGACWETRLAGSRLAFLRDHRVQGGAVFPGAGYVEAALEAVGEGGDAFPIVIEDVRFRAAFGLGRAPTLRLAIDDDGRVTAHGREGDGPWTLQAEARWERKARYAAPSVCAPDGPLPETPGPLYDALAARGLEYGPAFRGVRALRRGDGEVWAEIDGRGALDDAFRLHPALLDAAFQALIAALPAGADGLLLPVGIRRVQVLRPAGLHLFAHGRLTARDAHGFEGDLLLVEPDGQPVARLTGFRCQRVAAAAAGEGWLHHPRWDEAPPPPAATPRLWRVEGGLALPGLEPDGGVPTAAAIAAALRAAGDTVADVTTAAELRAAGDTVADVAPGPERAAAASGDTVADVAPGRASGVVHVVEGVASLAASLRRWLADPPREVVVVTRGAQGPDAADPDQAAALGLARVAMTEAPSLRLRLVDWDGHGDPAAAIRADDEEETALRDGRRLALRWSRGAPPAPEAAPAPVDPARVPVALGTLEPGRFERLAWIRTERRPPGPGEVEIAIEAASLNFKDVMKALGVLAEAALERSYLGSGLGMEAAGRVVAVGEGVTHVAVGARVLAYFGGALRSYVTAPAAFVVPVPDALDRHAAACCFVFMTAWHALVDVGRVRRGDRVLIHSAAGGVGLAAVQIARHLGAEVFATAGTPEKRALLRDLGLRHVYDSRTLDFADAIRADTGGRGVDVVLNSLAGAALDRSLDCLAPGGRFLELGKQDIAADRPLGLRPFNRCLTFAAIDLDRMATEDPTFFAPLARAVLDAFRDGVLTPLPMEVFAPDDAEAAFRRLASGRLAGKAVIDLTRGAVHAVPRPPAIRSDRAYLVTGGLQGFGFATAGWLVDQGARHLVLASRRGAPESPERVAAWRAAGVRVDTVALDVADAAAVQALVDRTPTLAGVFHAAAVLEDEPLARLTALDRVFAPKAVGAWNLHLATRDRPLELFVLYSSISAEVGNPGQAAYAAANTFLDGLAALRRREGLAATSVAWGVLGEAGMVARDPAVEAHLRSLGLRPMPPRDALDRLVPALATHAPLVAVVDIDWGRWRAAHPDTPWRRLAGLDEGARDDRDFAAALAQLSGPARVEAVVARVTPAVAAVFRLDPAQLDPARPLRDFGLDSLMAVELAGAIRDASGFEVTAMELLTGRSLHALAERLLTRLKVDAAPDEPFGARICVQPPYFRLENVRRAGDAVEAEVELDLPAGAPVSAAEAGRHLAILGSCAVSLHNPLPGRSYYPVQGARLRLEADVPAGRLRLSARCTAYHHVASEAHATAVLHALDGRLVATLDVDYHVIPADAFRARFAAHAAPTAEAGAPPDAYARLPALDALEVAGDRAVGTLAAVPPSACLGHFAGHPALPVAIMGRYVEEVVRAAAGAGRVAAARITTTRFAWAGQAVRFVAAPDGETWTCAVQVREAERWDEAARFVLTLER